MLPMATNHIKYDSEHLRKNGNKANITSHLSSFYLDIVMRRQVIELGIRKYPRPYKRLKGGCKIFHRIATISITKTNRVKPIQQQQLTTQTTEQ